MPRVDCVIGVIAVPHHTHQRKLKLVREARACDTPLTRANHTSWALSSPAPTFPVLQRWLAWQEATFFISPAHGRCCTLLSIQYTLLNGSHVLGALAIYRTASFLWHCHRVLSLLRNDVCHLHVQETYRGQCDDKG